MKRDDILSELFDIGTILENYSCEYGDTESHVSVLQRIGKRLSQLGIILANEEAFK